MCFVANFMLSFSRQHTTICWCLLAVEENFFCCCVLSPWPPFSLTVCVCATLVPLFWRFACARKWEMGRKTRVRRNPAKEASLFHFKFYHHRWPFGGCLVCENAFTHKNPPLVCLFLLFSFFGLAGRLACLPDKIYQTKHQI